MKQKQSWFQLYPESNRASNLSIAGGAVRLLSLLLLIAAIGATLVLLLAGARLTAAAGVGTALIFLLDELGRACSWPSSLWARGAGVPLRRLRAPEQGRAAGPAPGGRRRHGPGGMTARKSRRPGGDFPPGLRLSMQMESTPAGSAGFSRTAGKRHGAWKTYHAPAEQKNNHTKRCGYFLVETTELESVTPCV